MHPNEQRLHELFDRLNAHDVKGIMECYHEQAKFEDIAFRLENRDQIRAMWDLICSDEAKTEIQASVKAASADDRIGRAEVEEDYYYGKGARRRKVHNRIVSTFEFRDGLITSQKDKCDPVSWANQALGGIIGFIAGHAEPIRRAMAMRKVKRHRPQAFL